MTFRIAQISDTHLSAEKPFFERRMLGKVILYFEQPDL